MGKLSTTGNRHTRKRLADLSTIVPTDVANLHTWYDGASTGDITINGSNQVSLWAGHGGHGATLTRTASNAVKSGVDSQNGLNVVTFDGTGLLSHGTPFMYAATAVTVLCVATLTGTSASSLETIVGETNSADASSQAYVLRAQTITSPSNELILSSAKAGTGQWLTAQSGVSPLSAGYKVMGFQIDTAPVTDTWEIRYNSASAASGTFTKNTTTTINSLDVGGMRFTSNSHYWVGKIAEIIAYDRKLTAAEIGGLEYYLARRWAA